jgi:hypothetical protein
MSKKELFEWKTKLTIMRILEDSIELKSRKVALGDYKHINLIPFNKIEKIFYKYVGKGFSEKAVGGFVLFETSLDDVKNVEFEEIIGVYKRQHQDKRFAPDILLKNDNAFQFENYSYLDLGNSKLDEFLKITKHHLNFKEPDKESSNNQADTSIVYELEKLDKLRSKGVINEEEFSKAKNKLLEQ